MISGEIWVIDDDKSIRWVLRKALEQENISSKFFETGELALDALSDSVPAGVVTDIKMPGIDGFSLFDSIKNKYPDVPVVIMTAYSDLNRAVESYHKGAFDYLPKPFDLSEFITVVKRALRADKELSGLKPSIVSKSEEVKIIGSSPPMQEVFKTIGRLAKVEMTVLITGESGTGKEIVARSLHAHSPRKEGPFIAINAAAVPKELLESELFGHERGAFTGADSRRLGRFEQALGGTLFLDEIGDMTNELQTRLLRVLSDGHFYRVGGKELLKADVRIITATHQKLEDLVEKNQFRLDLFHRLNVIRIHLPALRDRVQDIPELTRYFLSGASNTLELPPKIMSEESELLLGRFSWPGNIRQLKNVCEKLAVMVPSSIIFPDDLPEEIGGGNAKPEDLTTSSWETELDKWAEKTVTNSHSTLSLLDAANPRFESVLIKVALRASNGKRQDAAKILGWGRNTLAKKMKDLGL